MPSQEHYFHIYEYAVEIAVILFYGIKLSGKVEIPMEYVAFTVENALKINGSNGKGTEWLSIEQWREAIQRSFFVIIDGLNDELKPVDVAVVLGNKVEVNGQPSERLKARLDKSVELYGAILLLSL